MTTPVRRVLLDTNVLLDLLLRREPWMRDAGNLLDALARGRGRALVAGHTVTTLHYLLTRAVGKEQAHQAVRALLEWVEVVPVDTALMRRALSSGIGDFEDAVQAVAADFAGACCIATRNLKDFSRSSVPAELPGVIAESLRANSPSPETPGR